MILYFNLYVRCKGSLEMTKVCEVTKKKQSRGYKYVTRGIAKKKKGIGIKVTGKTKRSFLPNLQQKKIWFAEENRFITLRLSCDAIRLIHKQGLAHVIRKLRAQGQKI